MPAHVTILYPFLPTEQLTTAVRSELETIVAMNPSFTARFAAVERLERLVWLLPFDQAPFLRLTAAIVERWPDCPPYGGMHDEIVAHLTLVETTDASILDTAEGVGQTRIPFECRVGELRLIVATDAGRWKRRWNLPLGGRG